MIGSGIALTAALLGRAERARVVSTTVPMYRSNPFLRSNLLTAFNIIDIIQ
jgi:hypothetical protein